MYKSGKCQNSADFLKQTFHDRDLQPDLYDGLLEILRATKQDKCHKKVSN